MSSSLLFQTETQDLRIQTRDDNEAEMEDTTNSSSYSSLNEISTDSALSVSGSSSIIQNSTAASEQSIDYTTNNITQYTTTPLPNNNGAAGIAIAIILVLVLISAFLILIYCYMRKQGKLAKLSWFRPSTRARRSSTSSSRRALEEHEVMDNTSRPKPDGQDDDMFTIDEFENATDPASDPAGGREEYYYDEVFGQSQFEDEATNNAMRHLYSDSQALPEEEILDLDFETLGIKIEDYSPEPGRKNIVI